MCQYEEMRVKLTDISDAEENLEVENYLINKLFEKPESVIDKIMVSTMRVRDKNSVSSGMLIKVRKFDRLELVRINRYRRIIQKIIGC